MCNYRQGRERGEVQHLGEGREVRSSVVVWRLSAAAQGSMEGEEAGEEGEGRVGEGKEGEVAGKERE